MKKFKFLIRSTYLIVLLEIFYYLRIAPQVVGTHFVSDNIPDSLGSKYQLFLWELLILIMGESIILIEKNWRVKNKLDNLPKLSLGRNTEKQITMCFAANNDPNWQTQFE